MSFLAGNVERDVGAGFVVEHLAVAVIAVHGDQHVAGGIGRAHPAGLTAESAEHDRMNYSQPGAGEHGDRQLGNHRHMDGDAVSCFQSAEVAQQCGEFIHPHIEFAIGHRHHCIGLWFGNKNQRGFIFIFRQMPIDAVV